MAFSHLWCAKADAAVRTEHAVMGGVTAARMSLRALGLALLLLVGGCSQQLYGALDEHAANEVVGALLAEGVRASKERGTDAQWRVTVATDEFARAVQILKRRNLPSRDFEGLGRVFRKDSLVSTPTEERARLIFALSQELERTLTEMDGVIVARVHPVIPPQDQLNAKPKVASASVFVKYRAGADLSQREAMIRALVASGIEGLRYEDVRVLMVAAEPRSLAEEVPAVSRAVPPLFWGVLGVLLGLLVASYFVLTWRDRAVGALDGLRGRLIRKQQSAGGGAGGEA
jgi:type III secretion protein J